MLFTIISRNTINLNNELVGQGWRLPSRIRSTIYIYVLISYYIIFYIGIQDHIRYLLYNNIVSFIINIYQGWVKLIIKLTIYSKVK